jgi:hypothetical protein
MGRVLNMFPELQSCIDKTPGMGIFVNIFPDPGFLIKP